MSYSDRKDLAFIDIAIQKMMQLFKEWFYGRHNSVDSKTCIFHSHLLHTTSGRVKYGGLLQYDTGKGAERNLKCTKKGMAYYTAQKGGEDICVQQTGDCTLH